MQAFDVERGRVAESVFIGYFIDMKVYLDTCSLQRPLDDKSQLRIRLEAEAILSVLELARIGRVQLVSSDVPLFEAGRTPFQARREFAEETILGFPIHVELTPAIEERAEELTNLASKR